jgi:tRNA pseudouridine55 synthase
LTEGIILLDKPAGQTSFQSLGFLKRSLGTRRIGHAGTLDKFAEGLLIVLVGRMTRLCPLAMSLDKEYVATFVFGRGTDTLDPEGTVTAEGPVPSQREVTEVLPEFTGSISQVPPDYSAVHVGGRRASEAVRSGEAVTLRARPVRIDLLEMLDYQPPAVQFRVSCTKGTYIRSLARDMAARLGTCAHVSKLRRTRIGGFSVDKAQAQSDFDASRHVLTPAAFFEAVPSLGRLIVRPEWVIPVGRGARLEPSHFERPPQSDGIAGVFSRDGNLLAVVEASGSEIRYLAAFPGNP